MKAPVKKFVFKPATSPAPSKTARSSTSEPSSKRAPTPTAGSPSSASSSTSLGTPPSASSSASMRAPRLASMPRARAQTERTVTTQSVGQSSAAPSTPNTGDTEPLLVPPPPSFNRSNEVRGAKPPRVPTPRPSIGSSRTAKPLPVRRSPSGSITVRKPPTGAADLGEEVDAAFDGAKVSGDDVAGPGRMQSTADVLQELRRLFGEIASHHTAQIRDFIVELSRGPTSKQWAEICAPSLDSIRRAADGIAHPELSETLLRFEKALDDTRRGDGGAMISGERRTQLIEAYGALTKILPEAFDLERHRGRRDPIIIHILLEQVPGLTTLARERIYAAGLSTLEVFYAAKADELAAATGVPPGLSQRIVERFAAYRASRAERAERAQHSAEREHLADLVEQLRARQQDFRKAELEESIRDKRRLRDERASLARQIDLALAHLGEIDLIEEIKRAPVDAKIERVARFLRQPAGT